MIKIINCRCNIFKMKKLAFFVNKLTLRGTEIALYDYAHYNETLLGNQSIVITYNKEMVKNSVDYDEKAYEKFSQRFPVFYCNTRDEIEDIIVKESIDIFYIIKSGESNDNLYVTNCKCVVHCIFNTQYPHGDIYATISPCVNKINGTNVPIVPHIVTTYDTSEDLRDELNIPRDAIVFGTYAGLDMMNIDYVKKVACDVSSDPAYSNIYFIFMNIHQFSNNDRMRFLEGTTCQIKKTKFINTCNAMYYGRNGGESFGLACGEFSIQNKPVIAKLNEFHNNHLDVLGDNIIGHTCYDELYHIITNWNMYNKNVENNAYKQFTPEIVMEKFNSVFIL